MKRKRLDRDLWEFTDSFYHQMRVDTAYFRGLAGFLRLANGGMKNAGQTQYWDRPKAGRVAICGKGMVWLQLIPDGKHHMLTAKYLPDGKVSIWYADVIENIEYDPDAVAVFIDKYLDVTFTPQGDVSIDDHDELDDAYRSGELSQAQYLEAIAEGNIILEDYCADVAKTILLCDQVFAHTVKHMDKAEGGMPL